MLRDRLSRFVPAMAKLNSLALGASFLFRTYVVVYSACLDRQTPPLGPWGGAGEEGRP